MNKVVCIKNCTNLFKDSTGLDFNCYIDQVYDYNDCGSKAIVIYVDGKRMGYFIRRYFISLAEWRDEQIEKILRNENEEDS